MNFVKICRDSKSCLTSQKLESFKRYDWLVEVNNFFEIQLTNHISWKTLVSVTSVLCGPNGASGKLLDYSNFIYDLPGDVLGEVHSDQEVYDNRVVVFDTGVLSKR